MAGNPTYKLLGMPVKHAHRSLVSQIGHLGLRSSS